MNNNNNNDNNAANWIVLIFFVICLIGVCIWSYGLITGKSSSRRSSSESSYSSSQSSSSNSTPAVSSNSDNTSADSTPAVSSDSDSTPEVSQVQINMPELPQTFTREKYSSVSHFTVKDISYAISTSYDNTNYVEFTALVTLDSKVGEENVSDYVMFGYKLYDNDNVVVDSGTVYTDSISIGESTKKAFTIYSLDPTQTYTLKIMQSN